MAGGREGPGDWPAQGVNMVTFRVAPMAGQLADALIDDNRTD